MYNPKNANIMLESSGILSSGIIPSLIKNNPKKSDELENFHEVQVNLQLNQHVNQQVNQQQNSKIIGNLKDLAKYSFQNKFNTMKNLPSSLNPLNFHQMKRNLHHSYSNIQANSPRQLMNNNFNKNLMPKNKCNSLYQSITINTARSQVLFDITSI